MMRNFLNIPSAADMNNLREAALAEQAAFTKRLEEFTANLRQRVVSEGIVCLIQSAAKNGDGKAHINYSKIRTAFFIGGDVLSDESSLALLKKVVGWSEEDPVAWDLSFLKYDLSEDETRLNLGRSLCNLAFCSSTSSEEEFKILLDVVTGLIPDFEAAGYTVECNRVSGYVQYFTFSGW